MLSDTLRKKLERLGPVTILPPGLTVRMAWDLRKLLDQIRKQNEKQ